MESLHRIISHTSQMIFSMYISLIIQPFIFALRKSGWTVFFCSSSIWFRFPFISQTASSLGAALTGSWGEIFFPSSVWGLSWQPRTPHVRISRRPELPQNIQLRVGFTQRLRWKTDVAENEKSVSPVLFIRGLRILRKSTWF